MQDWIKQEQETLELDAKEFAEANKLPFWTPPEGESKIEIDTTHEPFETKFKGKKVLHIFVEGDAKLWSVSTKSPIWRDLIKNLALGKKIFKLIRIGKDVKNTRYSLVVIE